MRKYIVSFIDYSLFIFSIVIGFIIYAYPLYLIAHLFSNKPRAFFQLATKHVFKIMFYLSPSVKEIKVTGLEFLETHRNFIITPTHRSFLDYLLIEWLLHDIVLFTNKPLTRLWIYRHVSDLLGANVLHNDSYGSYYKLFDNFKKELENGTNVLIFPEGSRNSTNTLLPFKDGAFKLSIISKVPILPIVINGTDKIYKKGSFLNITKMRQIVTIDICEPIYAGDHESSRDFSIRVRNILQTSQNRVFETIKN